MMPARTINPTLPLILFLLILAAGCTQPAPSSSPAADAPVIWIVYGSEKGDLSYTDAAARGVTLAEQEMPLTVREFTPADAGTLPALLASTPEEDRPGLIVTVGFQYADLVQHLASENPGIRFLAIDTSGIGSANVRSLEITSYGDSYLVR